MFNSECQNTLVCIILGEPLIPEDDLNPNKESSISKKSDIDLSLNESSSDLEPRSPNELTSLSSNEKADVASDQPPASPSDHPTASPSDQATAATVIKTKHFICKINYKR